MQRNTKAPVNKKSIQKSSKSFIDGTITTMDEIYLNRQVITKYTLSRVKKSIIFVNF